MTVVVPRDRDEAIATVVGAFEHLVVQIPQEGLRALPERPQLYSFALCFLIFTQLCFLLFTQYNISLIKCGCFCCMKSIIMFSRSGLSSSSRTLGPRKRVRVWRLFRLDSVKYLSTHHVSSETMRSHMLASGIVLGDFMFVCFYVLFIVVLLYVIVS